MTSIYQYIEKNQSVSLLDKPLTEVDLLILNELVYFPIEQLNFTPAESLAGIRLEDFFTLIDPFLSQMKENWVLASNDRIKILKKVTQAERYRDIKLFAFESEIERIDEYQFAALSLRLPNQTVMISYRGTDDSLVGWKEDCNMSFQSQIPSQGLAADYLARMFTLVAGDGDAKLVISGHSKGGNLAIYAAAVQEPLVQDAIELIFSFDGPGFHQATLDEVAYQRIQHKIRHYVPEDSIVGMMLLHSQAPIVVKSKGMAFSHHIVTKWYIDGDQLQRIERRSDLSYLIDASLKEWAIDRSEEELASIFNESFNIIYQTGVQSLVDISQNPLQFSRLFLNHLHTLEPELKTFLDDNLGSFFDILRSHLVEQRRDHYQETATNISQWLKELSLTSKLPVDSSLLQKIKQHFQNNQTIPLTPPVTAAADELMDKMVEDESLG